MSLVSESPERSAPVWVTSCHHQAARHTDVGGLVSARMLALLPLPPALGDGFMFHFSQFMPIIIIVIQHDRITPRHYKQVSTVLLTCLCSDLILSVSIQLNYDSIINFANYNSSSVPSSPFIGAPYLLVVSTKYNVSTRLHNWRGLSFVLFMPSAGLCPHFCMQCPGGGHDPGHEVVSAAAGHQTRPPAAVTCLTSDMKNRKVT